MKDEELYDIVIYDITAGTVTEKMYLTRNLVTSDININSIINKKTS